MRLWSIHPKYLDTKGLLALWREALLAKHVLQNKTEAYNSHPQLIRFKNQSSPINAIENYLKGVLAEAKRRNFNFDAKKIGSPEDTDQIPVSSVQIRFEFEHLLKKLKERDKNRYNLLNKEKKIEVHPLFKEVPGGIEKWERI